MNQSSNAVPSLLAEGLLCFTAVPLKSPVNKGFLRSGFIMKVKFLPDNVKKGMFSNEIKLKFVEVWLLHGWF